VKFCSETFASLFTCWGLSKLLNSFVAEDFFVFELGVEYALASVQYSYKSRQQTLRTSTKLMSTQHTASFVVDRSRGERVSKRIYYVRPLCYTELSRSNFFQRLWHNRMTLDSRHHHHHLLLHHKGSTRYIYVYIHKNMQLRNTEYKSTGIAQ